MSRYRTVVPALVAGLVSGAATAQASARVTVTTSDGLALSAYVSGNPAGPGILFIHGFTGAAVSWHKQTRSDLAKTYRMVAVDLRGHGTSHKPSAVESYSTDRLWAEDIAAVIKATGLIKPVLVAYPYGGRVVCNYLKAFGDSTIAGINFVAAQTKADPAFFGEGGRALPKMRADDLAQAIEATVEFWSNATARPQSATDWNITFGATMLVPPQVRGNLMGRNFDCDDALKAITVPVLVTHGAEDRLIKDLQGGYTAKVVPGEKLSLYEGVGHAPYDEDPGRFNRELAEFVKASAAPRR